MSDKPKLTRLQLRSAEHIHTLKALFDGNQKFNLWIMEYGITHEWLKVAIFPAIFPKRIEVSCLDCKSISGLLKCPSPYTLTIDQGIHGGWVINGAGDKNNLQIEFEHILNIQIIPDPAE